MSDAPDIADQICNGTFGEPRSRAHPMDVADEAPSDGDVSPASPEDLLAAIPADSTGDLGALLQPVFTALVGADPLRQDRILDLIATRFKATHRPRRPALLKMLRQAAASPAKWERSRRKGLPEIFVSNRQAREILAQALAVVAEANARRLRQAGAPGLDPGEAPIFLRGGTMVRLHHLAPQPPKLVVLDDAAVYGLLFREADWYAVVPGGQRVAAFPLSIIARDLRVFPPPFLPEVDAVVTTPTFGHSGNLLSTPGLHAEDRLWLALDGSLTVDTVPQRPTQEDVNAARALLLEDLLCDFPFAAASDRAHALAALLLPFVRRLVPGCTPLHLIESPTPGTGKGLLASLVSIVATGAPCAGRTLPDTDDEVRKAITAELSQGRPIVLLDNFSERLTLTAAPLASVLTMSLWTDRVLGRNEMVTLPNNALWVLTANNPKLALDIARRSVRIRLDAKVDRPWIRSGFAHDPIEDWASKNRPRLVNAALVLIQAWLAAGCPRGGRRLGSFEGWAAVMGGVLDVVGVPGFLEDLEEVYRHADEQGEAWRAFTSTWWEHFGPAPTYVSELLSLCETEDLLMSVRGDGNPKSQQSRLGRALRRSRDRVYSDLQVLVLDPDSHKRTPYALRRVGGASESPDGGDGV